MKYILVLVTFAAMMVGCAHNAGDPTTPILPGDNQSGVPAAITQAIDSYDGPHRLWGEWIFFIDAEHERVDVVPHRQGRFHLNALKFLEEYCTDCLEITNIHNNGDETIDLTVEITHPFPDLPQYTGFDVKGIIMFQGSHEIPENLSKLPLYPENYRLSWRLMGDPELMNADGFTYLWSPWYDSGSTMPIFNYWPGKYSNGTPTANVNGFLNFYSNEDRHMFEVGETVSCTYHISLPPGPVIAGYAIDACWEPPTVTPVTNPADDFPITANQPECYHFKVVINDGQPITPDDPCIETSVYESRGEFQVWYVLPPGFTNNRWVGAWCEEIKIQKPGYATSECNNPPEHPDWRCFLTCIYWNPHPADLPNGVFQFFAHEYHAKIFNSGWKVLYPAFDVFEVVIDLD